MAEYQLIENGGVLRNADGASIPCDTENRDWQQYQAWVTDGGVADPAPEQSPQEIADAEARASALAKIESAAGLTADEKIALFGTSS